MTIFLYTTMPHSTLQWRRKLSLLWEWMMNAWIRNSRAEDWLLCLIPVIAPGIWTHFSKMFSHLFHVLYNYQMFTKWPIFVLFTQIDHNSMNGRNLKVSSSLTKLTFCSWNSCGVCGKFVHICIIIKLQDFTILIDD